MKEMDENRQLQRTQMESAILLAEAVEKATDLDFTIVINGGTADVLPWLGKPLVIGMMATSDTLFEADYLTNLIDWLDGFACAKTEYKKEHVVYKGNDLELSKQDKKLLKMVKQAVDWGSDGAPLKDTFSNESEILDACKLLLKLVG